ncbi:MAG TPA: hypothetical protein VK392_03560 [Thermoanaerobaculia bacterium]|nr:hypothetical protein [Thermoanaerobaculia bacterium]
MSSRRNIFRPRSAADVSKAFTCSFCRSVSHWTRVTPDHAMYCLFCRCGYCAGLLAFQSADEGEPNLYCPRCIREGDAPEAVVN